ncbi:MAG: hypothetical protein V5A52_05630 [Halovenus sp.]
MSSEHATDIDNDGATAERNRREPTISGVTVTRRTVVVGSSLVALLAVTFRAVVRLLANVPFDPLVVSPAFRTAAVTAVPVTAGAALAGIALTDDRPTVRVGLLFTAVFGPLGVVAPAATLPAVVGVTGGAGLALVGTLGVPASLSYRCLRSRVIAAAFLGAIGISLADSTGIVRGMHGVGSLLALTALAAIGTRAERTRLAAVAGILVAAAVVYASTASPFVVGSALLVVFAVTGVPHLLFALAAAGGAAAVTFGLSRRAYPLAIGAALLVLAGVPVTLPRAMVVVLGAALVVLDWELPGEVPA